MRRADSFEKTLMLGKTGGRRRRGPQRRLSSKEWTLLNCGVGEDSWESLGLQGYQTSPNLKEINPEYSLEGLMLKLKLQYFGHLLWRADSLEKTLMLGKIEGNNSRGQQRRIWLDSFTGSMGMNLSKLWETVKDRGACHAVVGGTAKSLTGLATEKQQ